MSAIANHIISKSWFKIFCWGCSLGTTWNLKDQKHILRWHGALPFPSIIPYCKEQNILWSPAWETEKALIVTNNKTKICFAFTFYIDLLDITMYIWIKVWLLSSENRIYKKAKTEQKCRILGNYNFLVCYWYV